MWVGVWAGRDVRDGHQLMGERMHQSVKVAEMMDQPVPGQVELPWFPAIPERRQLVTAPLIDQRRLALGIGVRSPTAQFTGSDAR